MNATHTRPPQPTRRGPGWLKRLIAPLLVLVAVTGVGVVAWLPRNQPAPEENRVPPVSVEVLTVEAIREFPDTFRLTAVVEPWRVVRVAAEVAERIERLGRRQRAVTWQGRPLPAGAVLEEGQPIAKGDPIVYLNKDLLQTRLDRAQTQYDYDLREYQRILDLHERRVTSKTELDDARTRRDVSKATLDEVNTQIERTTIAAPISGILNRLPMEVGEYVSAGDPVAEIVEIETVKVVVDVPERDVHFLKVGDTAQVLTRTPEGMRLTGEITYVDALAHEGSRTTRVEIALDNRRRLLRSGQIVRARLTRRVLKDVIMIPLGAVIPLEQGRVVYVVNDNHAERRRVELGFIRGHSVRVLGGLGVGDRLIVSGHRYVGPGQAVNVKE